MDGNTSELTKVVEQVVEQMWDRYQIIKEVTAIPIGMEEIAPTELRRRFPNMTEQQRFELMQREGLENVLAMMRRTNEISR